MMKRNGFNLRMNACPRCGGAAYCEDVEENEWRCLQCARTVAPPIATAEAFKVKPAQAA